MKDKMCGKKTLTDKKSFTVLFIGLGDF